MPQVWLTYDELGSMFGIGSQDARAEAIQCDWPRRRCSDGATRVKLPPAAAHEFIIGYATQWGRATAPVESNSPIMDLQRQAASLAAELAERTAKHGASARATLAALTHDEGQALGDGGKGRSAAA